MVDFPIADVSRGKVVAMGKNKEFKDGDHDFSIASFVPDATLVYFIPENDREEDEENTNGSKDTDEKLCNGKCYLNL